MARLTLTYNHKIISNHVIAPGQELVIGRDPDNKIMIDHPAVSHHHARISNDEQGLHLYDLGSTNGTIVNDEKVMSCQLAHQDWVVVGKHLIIVDLYETLSLETTAQLLSAGISGAAEADGTMLIDMDLNQSSTQQLDFISFMSDREDDFELSERPVFIGKNKDADIVIKGLWTFLAGEPTARIEKHSGDYYLEFVAGMLKPKVNDQPVRRPTKLNHHDVIKVGPLKMRIHRTLVA